jgi:hypothetical protein
LGVFPNLANFILKLITSKIYELNVPEGRRFGHISVISVASNLMCKKGAMGIG